VESRDEVEWVDAAEDVEEVEEAGDLDGDQHGQSLCDGTPRLLLRSHGNSAHTFSQRGCVVTTKLELHWLLIRTEQVQAVLGHLLISPKLLAPAPARLPKPLLSAQTTPAPLR
jgi:hypothetical protein